MRIKGDDIMKQPKPITAKELLKAFTDAIKVSNDHHRGYGALDKLRHPMQVKS